MVSIADAIICGRLERSCSIPFAVQIEDIDEILFGQHSERHSVDLDTITDLSSREFETAAIYSDPDETQMLLDVMKQHRLRW